MTASVILSSCVISTLGEISQETKTRCYYANGLKTPTSSFLVNIFVLFPNNNFLIFGFQNLEHFIL